MAGFDFINNTIKSGDRSMAGLDPIEVYISKWIIRLWYDFMFSIWFTPTSWSFDVFNMILPQHCDAFDQTGLNNDTIWCQKDI